jgi:hypothetical protein
MSPHTTGLRSQPYHRLRFYRRALGGFRAAIIVLLFVGSAAAQNVLVWSSGNSDGNTGNVAAWLQASGQFTSVTGINSNAMLPLATLLGYDRLLYFSNHSETQDPTAIGNVLADYADTGRCLVLSTFAFASQGGNTLGGRIISDQISPYFVAGSSLYSNVTMASNDGSSFFTGVNSVSGNYHDNVGLMPGATGRALWSDGSSLLATNGNVVGVNLFPDDSFGFIGGDYRRLFVNALHCIPEPSTLLLVVTGMCALAVRRVTRH